MNHDSRFKKLLQTFFEDFFRLFFAEWAEHMDFSTVEWLDKELLPDAPEGSVHVVDLIARISVRLPVEGVHTTETLPWLVILHVEIESPDRTTLLKPRFPHYYFYLRQRYCLPVLPIALYLNVALDGIGIDTYSERFWTLEVNTFRYLYVGLPGLNGLEYIQGENWLGVALSALMRIPPDRVAWLGAEALRRLSFAPLNDQQRFLLGECVQAYLPMDERQRSEYQQLLSQDSYTGVQAMNKTVYEEGIEKGRIQGRVELAVALVEEQFGAISEVTKEYIAKQSMDELRQLILRVGKVNRLEELGLPQ